MIRALELLFALGAIDRSGHLSAPLGLQMAEFPLPPMHAKALLASGQNCAIKIGKHQDHLASISSGEFGCSEEMLPIIAMLQLQDVFRSPPGHKHKAVSLRMVQQTRIVANYFVSLLQELMKRRFSCVEGDHLTFLNIFTGFQRVYSRSGIKNPFAGTSVRLG